MGDCAHCDHNCGMNNYLKPDMECHQCNEGMSKAYSPKYVFHYDSDRPLTKELIFCSSECLMEFLKDFDSKPISEDIASEDMKEYIRRRNKMFERE